MKRSVSVIVVLISVLAGQVFISESAKASFSQVSNVTAEWISSTDSNYYFAYTKISVDRPFIRVTGVSDTSNFHSFSIACLASKTTNHISARNERITINANQVLWQTPLIDSTPGDEDTVSYGNPEEPDSNKHLGYLITSRNSTLQDKYWGPYDWYFSDPNALVDGQTLLGISSEERRNYPKSESFVFEIALVPPASVPSTDCQLKVIEQNPNGYGSTNSVIHSIPNGTFRMQNETQERMTFGSLVRGSNRIEFNWFWDDESCSICGEDEPATKFEVEVFRGELSAISETMDFEPTGAATLVQRKFFAATSKKSLSVRVANLRSGTYWARLREIRGSIIGPWSLGNYDGTLLPKNCRAINEEPSFWEGVARSKTSKDRMGKGGFVKKPGVPLVDPWFYADFASLDKDRDGIACENRLPEEIRQELFP